MLVAMDVLSNLLLNHVGTSSDFLRDTFVF